MCLFNIPWRVSNVKSLLVFNSVNVIALIIIGISNKIDIITQKIIAKYVENVVDSWNYGI